MINVGSCQSPDRVIKAPPDIWNSAEDDVTWPLSFSESYFGLSSKLSFSPESSPRPEPSQFVKDLLADDSQRRKKAPVDRKESLYRLKAYTNGLEPSNSYHY
jgi:hypothetical protein